MIRFLDILFSFLGIIILFPAFIIISLILLFDHKWNIIFRQKRIGKGGKEFIIYKFRTMVKDHRNDSLLTLKSDTRITRTGSFLRKYKLDEIPQLFNVLKGDMSIVGPRPEIPFFTQFYSEKEKEVLSVKPGITDFASIEFSNEEKLLSEKKDPEKYYTEVILPKKIELNMKYIRNRSIKEYFKIILLTFKTIFR